MPTRLMLASCVCLLALSSVHAEEGVLPLNLRRQVETAPGSGIYHTITTPTKWDAAKTAVVICDMWDKHWCPASTARVAELAPRINEMIKVAREQGALIIHCPSDTMKFYEGTPQRKRAQDAPKVALNVEPKNWCHLDPEHESPLPIDDKDGGCDTVPPAKNYRAWSRQHPAIEIAENDAITDSAEALYLMESRGIENVIVTGVHTNMCVLGRPFGIRQLVYQGKNVVLMRDLTDTMYNPRSKPFVSHFTGTDLVISHIERFWAPTATSADLLGGEAFVFQDDDRPHLVMMIGESEYKTAQSLPKFAMDHLGQDFRVSYVHADEKDKNHFPGLEVIEDADILLVSVRRRTPPEKEMALIRAFIKSGKPVVGIRTASHAFELRNGKPPQGHAQWANFDKEVLGCDYTGHYGNKAKAVVWVPEAARKHPVARGLKEGEVGVSSSLYKSSPLNPKAEVVMMGKIAGQEPEPVAWTFTHPGGGRVFYTSLGHVGDFELPRFQRMLKNGILWAANRPVAAD